ncbi:hypothetical protein HUJ04_009208 [Dendroctonus ponderosae]|nr:hypothetical protein HUJ04_009208 [Dendroctonus ponderosae]
MLFKTSNQWILMRATDLNLCLDTVIDESYESSQQDSNSSSNELEKTEDNFRFGKRNVKKSFVFYYLYKNRT